MRKNDERRKTAAKLSISSQTVRSPNDSSKRKLKNVNKTIASHIASKKKKRPIDLQRLHKLHKIISFANEEKKKKHEKGTRIEDSKST